MKMHQCGLPKEMALELFKPFVMKRLQDNDPSRNIRAAKRMVERATAEVWDVLDEGYQRTSGVAEPRTDSASPGYSGL